MRRALVFIFSLAILGACGQPANNGNTDAGGSTPVPPTFTVTPANGATGVLVTLPSILIKSSEPLDPTSVSSMDVTLTDSTGHGVTITTSLSMDGLTMTIALPAAGLTGDMMYSLYVSGLKAAASAGGLPQTTPIEVSFTTSGAAPALIASTPGNTANGVGTDVRPTLTFTEPVTDTTPSSITILAPMLGSPPAMSPVTATVTFPNGPRTAVITPTQATCQDGQTHNVLCENTQYNIVIGPGLVNSGGMPFVGAPLTVVSFTTENIPPAVASVMPADMSTGIAANVQPTVVFTHAMNAATINSTPTSIPTITIEDATAGAAVPATVTLGTDFMTATIAPSMPVTLGDNFLLTITTGVEDYSNLPLVTDDVIRFSTTAATPTATISFDPPASMGMVISTAEIVATFSEPVTNVTTTTFTLSQGSTLITGTTVIPSGNGISASLVPPQLMLNTTYTVNLTNGITSTDATPVPLMPFTTTFTTGSM